MIDSSIANCSGIVFFSQLKETAIMKTNTWVVALYVTWSFHFKSTEESDLLWAVLNWKMFAVQW